METIEDRQWHGHVRNDRPRPEAVEVQLNRMTFRATLLQRTNRPHGQIGDQQKRDNLSAWLFAHLLGRGGTSAARVQDEHGLEGRLQDRGEGCCQHQRCVVAHDSHKLATDHGERAVEEQPRLCAHQENVVQLEAPQRVILQVAHLQHSDDRGNRGGYVERQFADCDLCHGQINKLRAGDQDEEENERDYGEDQRQDAQEQATVRLSTVYRVMVR